MPPKEKKDKESSKAKDDKLKGKGKTKVRGEATNEDLVQGALAAANGRPVISSGQDASSSQSVGASSKAGGIIVGGEALVGEVTGAGACGRRGPDAVKVCPCLIQGSPVPNATSTHNFVLSNDKLHQTFHYQLSSISA
jgi:hypothetical protein